MSTDLTLQAKGREDTGKGASRRLRRLAGEIPAIIYGGGAKKKPAQISLIHKDVMKSLENEAFYSQILTLDVDGKSEEVILKDVQRHPAKPVVLHMDFLRVNKNTLLTTRAPIHFINEDICVGVKVGGGLIAHSMTELDIQCLPKDLPEYVEIDMAELDLGQTLHISDIVLPEGVESVALNHGADHDLPVVSVNKPKAAPIEDDEAAPESEEGGTEEASEE